MYFVYIELPRPLISLQRKKKKKKPKTKCNYYKRNEIYFVLSLYTVRIA